jgi:tetratricopeptide (TPR) repeat protein
MTENPIYNKSTKAPQMPANRTPPRSDDESSSNQTRIDLSPPASDSVAHPDGGHVGATDVHEWNPLRAMKCIEIGNYYYKNGNYKGALSRYREALQFKPRDAAATFKLAQALEKTRDFEQARIRYQEYLEILKDGPSAEEAKKALARLQK